MLARLTQKITARPGTRKRRPRSAAPETFEPRLLLTVAFGDFNGDGHQDMAVGVPGENIDDIPDAGAVNVIYGTPTGLRPGRNQLWSQDSRHIAGVAEPSDRFGAALATGDFNGDSFDDLAIGAPGEWIGEIRGAGAVNVLYGTQDGLRARGDQIWHQNSLGISDQAEPFDGFGSSLATGDFDLNGFADLAIGAPGETIDGQSGAGAVHILFGDGTHRLHAADSQYWHQGRDDVNGGAEHYDNFGAALVVGQFGFGSPDDLAIGIPGEDVGGTGVDAGAVRQAQSGFGIAKQAATDPGSTHRRGVSGVRVLRILAGCRGF